MHIRYEKGHRTGPPSHLLIFGETADRDSSKSSKTKSLYFKITHFEPLRLHTVHVAVKMPDYFPLSNKH